MISKITTLSRPNMLGEIFNLDQKLLEQSSHGAREYFDIGFPMDEPFSPTGTVAIILERSFLNRNKTRFQWASAPDNGGVKCGFLPYLLHNNHKSVRLNFKQLSSLLKKIDTLTNEGINDVIYKRKSEDFCAAIRGLIDNEIVDGMLTQPMQAARRIEFCLEGAIETCDSDVRFALIPNTYKQILSRRHAKISQSKIIYYNPKRTLVDWLKANENICYWRV